MPKTNKTKVNPKPKPKPKHEQRNLFGDQDFVFNVLQTDLTDIDAKIENAHTAIDKKKTLIENLKDRKQEVEKAVAIILKQRTAIQKKSKKLKGVEAMATTLPEILEKRGIEVRQHDSIEIPYDNTQ